MNKNQEDTINQLIKQATKDESILGLILCGSVAKGTETDRSDIDVFVVVTDERFDKEKETKNYFWGTDFDSEEFNVEVDGKIIPKDFLSKVWQFGNECVKGTLYHSKVIYSRDTDIEKLLENKYSISIEQKNVNVKKFYSLMKSCRFSADDDLENILFVNKCIYDTVFYACRLVLAHNDILYPCVKNLHKALKQCKDLPDNFIPLMNKVMDSYDFNDVVEFYNCVDRYFKNYRFDNRLRRGYVLENELFWYFNTFPYSEI
jgi:predicted nucleotidyltransferase